MGVPKFFRWLSERYPRIIERRGCPPSEELCQEHFNKAPPNYLPPPDPLSTCGLPPPIDRLYIDMNGIIHGCSHNNQSADSEEEGFNQITEDEIFHNICYYLDRIVREIAQPTELLYLAIDGVAPRAKLNQQRARRYRSGKEGEIEKTVYDAHREALERERELSKERMLGDTEDAAVTVDKSESKVTEYKPGRFSGKFETAVEDSDKESLGVHTTDHVFHSNSITPGTPFFQRCCNHLTDFIQEKIRTDPAWQNLQVVFSGPDVPGEGEHKIMQFIREQRCTKDYNPNLRHCIMGQDGDLVMLGLATHEPNLFLLREKVLFERNRIKMEPLMNKYGLDVYIHNGNFELLHMNVLRDYLAFEFETSNVFPDSPFDLERTIDDFVFMTFLIGNDFLPHMPTLDIADEAFDLLFYIYRSSRRTWLKQSRRNTKGLQPYLVDGGNIVSGQRLESFLSAIGKHESSFYEFKRETEDLDQARKLDAKFGRQMTPDDDVLQAKEEHDQAKFRKLLQSSENRSVKGFSPVMTNKHLLRKSVRKEDVPGSADRLGSLSQYGQRDKSSGNMLEQDLKGRYYADKFGFSPFDVDNHLALRKAYIEGLVWNLKYYYEGCVSWEWFYPYHYGPMISDLVNVESLLDKVSFDELGEPLRPFEQLLACMPPSHASLLPPCYSKLMTDPSSPILDFYPRSFTVDMNGKRWPWEAAVLLPFIDSRRLRDAVATVDTRSLTEDEILRNSFGKAYVLCRSAPEGAIDATATVEPFEATNLMYRGHETPLLHAEILDGTTYPLPGLGTLRDGSVQSVWRKLIRVDVHGSSSRYKTAVLELNNSMLESFSAVSIAPELVGQHIYIGYPHLVEAMVVAISDANGIVRGHSDYVPFTSEESSDRKERLRKILKQYVFGEKVTGTGGLALAQGDARIEDLETLFHIRPLQSLATLPDGTMGKRYAMFELEVPSFVASWAPVNPDSRLDLPKLLESDPFKQRRSITSSRASKKSTRTNPFKGGSTLETGVLSQSRAFSTSPAFGLQDHPTVTSEPVRSLPTLMSNQRLRFGHFKPVRPLKQRSVPRRAPLPRSCRCGFLALGAFFFASLLPTAQASNWLHSPVSHNSPFSPEHWTRPVAVEERGVDDFWKSSENTPPIEFAHGTTTLAFTFEGGIIAAVDSRASLGAFVGSKTTQKVLPINTHMLGTMAGGAADCMFWIRRLRADSALFELTEGRRLSVARASRLLSNALYDNRRLGLSIGTMIMGFDDKTGAPPRIYFIDNSGMRIEGDMFAVGSGSTFALGILDVERRDDLTQDEAVALGIKAIRHATFRDAYSGGFINVYLITQDGWKHVFREDVAAGPAKASSGTANSSPRSQ